jgi:hypothetical protein
MRKLLWHSAVLDALEILPGRRVKVPYFGSTTLTIPFAEVRFLCTHCNERTVGYSSSRPLKYCSGHCANMASKARPAEGSSKPCLRCNEAPRWSLHGTCKYCKPCAAAVDAINRAEAQQRRKERVAYA